MLKLIVNNIEKIEINVNLYLLDVLILKSVLVKYKHYRKWITFLRLYKIIYDKNIN